MNLGLQRPRDRFAHKLLPTDYPLPKTPTMPSSAFPTGATAHAVASHPSTFALVGALALCVPALLLGSCSGGGNNASGVRGTSGDFLVLRTEPANNGSLFLNESIRIDFSNPVDLNTADLNTVAFQVFDAAGAPLSEQPSGSFALTASTGDASPGRRLEFVPRFPTNDTYDNGGFRPGRTYVVQLVGGDQRKGNVLLDSRGKGLGAPAAFRFTTANGAAPSQLFRDTKAGGPRRSGFTVLPSDATGAALSKGGQAASEIRLLFDQPLNPASANVPVAVELDPTRRSSGNRGRVYLEYDDPEPRLGRNTWIPARVVLHVNALSGSEVRLYPVGVLPNNATIRVIVENTLEDMAGESNVADASYDRIFATFQTRQAYEPQFDAIVESFQNTSNLDLTAAFLEPPAEINNGFVKANFSFEGSSTVLDYEPSTQNVILNTDFTQIVPKNAPPINVAGGVFNFRNVTIPNGVLVQGTGSKPMVWLVTGDFTVDGSLIVNGGDGSRVDTLNSANFPTPGGIGVCGGGNGGRGSPIVTAQSPTGETGFGPGQAPGGGGKGGNVNVNTTCGIGSAGGGGSYATQGDPYFKAKAGANNSFVQQLGVGGYGCRAPSGSTRRTVPGGGAGPLAFTDARADNDFWGSTVDVFRGIRITGELAIPQGGAGGGGGGDNSSQLNSPNWIADNKGGGGGGGGGVLIVKCLGTIRISSTGLISANGGNGGGGEQAGGNNQGGGGAGGSGGMIVLMAGEKIEIFTHGETYANRDYNQAISADGGVGTQGSFGGLAWSAKYPPPTSGAQWDSNPSGGFGGLGVIQLLVPAGDNVTDATNTVLDDNIDLYQGGTLLSGTEKIRFLGWRGFLNPTPGSGNRWIDDSGQPTYSNGATIDNEGDIRPAPLLMTPAFAHLSRVRTKLLDTGSTVRRALTSSDGQPRGVVEDLANNLLAGPRYEFTGTNYGPTSYNGYIDYVPNGVGGINLTFPAVLASPVPVSSVTANSAYDGRPAYEIVVSQPVLGNVIDRYSQYQAQLIDASSKVVGEYRILSHSDRRLYLSPDQGLLPSDLSGLSVQVLGKFFSVVTNGAPGLGPTYRNSSGGQSPVANLRIGFAFHRDAANAKTQGTDLDRLPNLVGTFLYDLSDPATQETVRTFMGTGTVPGSQFAMVDVLFNTRFSEDEPNNTHLATPFSPSIPRPELHFLVLPYRF